MAENIPMVEEELFFVWCFLKFWMYIAFQLLHQIIRNWHICFFVQHSWKKNIWHCTLLLTYCFPITHPKNIYFPLSEMVLVFSIFIVNLLFSNYSSKEYIFLYQRWSWCFRYSSDDPLIPHNPPWLPGTHLTLAFTLWCPLDPIGPQHPLFLKSGIISRTYRSCFYKNDKPNWQQYFWNACLLSDGYQFHIWYLLPFTLYTL